MSVKACLMSAYTVWETRGFLRFFSLYRLQLGFVSEALCVIVSELTWSRIWTEKVTFELNQMSLLFWNLFISSWIFFFIVHSDGGSKTECVDGGIGLVIESVDGCLFWEELTSCPFEEGSDSQERHYTCVIVHHLHTLTRTVEFSVTAAHVITHSRCSQDVLAAACIAVTYWFKSNT